MPPPYQTEYGYFNWRTRNEFLTDRPGWNESQKKTTISAIWAAHERVRQHFNGAARTDPGPDFPDWLIIPRTPYTRAQADAAKKSNAFIGLEADRYSEDKENSGTDEEGSETIDEEPASDEEDPERKNPDGRPYQFWPKLPWEDGPDPLVPVDDKIQRQVNAWLSNGAPEKYRHGHDWIGSRRLGKGGFGIAGLWVQVDAAGRIIDQMVIKDMARASSGRWRDPQQWRNRRPREIRIHELVEKRREAQPAMCRNLVIYRGSRMLMRQRRYRLYTEYCQGGDLLQRLAAVKNQSHSSSRSLPEPFVWHILKALTRACMILQAGTYEKDSIVAGWDPITHLDLQPGNVFLRLVESKENKDSKNAEPEEAQKRYSIEPVLGDFGLSFYSICKDSELLLDNPEDYIIRKSCARYAPEHQDQEGPEFIQLGQATDVWGIGHVIANLICNQLLMNGAIREDILLPEDTSIPPTDRVSRHRRWLPVGELTHGRPFRPSKHNMFQGTEGFFPDNAHFSDLLKKVVRQCLFYDPGERISLQRLFDCVEIAFERVPELTRLKSKHLQIVLGDISLKDSIGNRFSKKGPNGHA